MTYRLNRRSFVAHAAAGTTASLIGSEVAYADIVFGELEALIDTERTAIRAGMAEGEIGAAAVCVLNQGEPVWIEAFGQTERDCGRPVAPDTIFSIQSTSKNFTAVAVLLAVQEPPRPPASRRLFSDLQGWSQTAELVA